MVKCQHPINKQHCNYLSLSTELNKNIPQSEARYIYFKTLSADQF
jgi:hypothetical protein